MSDGGSSFGDAQRTLKPRLGPDLRQRQERVTGGMVRRTLLTNSKTTLPATVRETSLQAALSVRDGRGQTVEVNGDPWVVSREK